MSTYFSAAALTYLLLIQLWVAFKVFKEAIHSSLSSPAVGVRFCAAGCFGTGQLKAR
jgi:hypothetical protein